MMFGFEEIISKIKEDKKGQFVVIEDRRNGRCEQSLRVVTIEVGLRMDQGVYGLIVLLQRRRPGPRQTAPAGGKS